MVCSEKETNMIITLLKMLYPIGPAGPVNQGYANFNEKVWMTMVHCTCPEVLDKASKLP